MTRSDPHHEAFVPEEQAPAGMPSSLASESKSVKLINCTQAAALLCQLCTTSTRSAAEQHPDAFDLLIAQLGEPLCGSEARRHGVLTGGVFSCD